MNQETEDAIKEETNTTIEFMKRLNGAIAVLNQARGKDNIPEKPEGKKTLTQLQIIIYQTMKME